jgi:lysine decarboxylase
VEEAIDYMDEKGEEKLEELAAIYDKVKEDIGNTCFNNIHDKIEHDIKIIDKSKIWLAPGGIGDILTRDYNIDVEFDDGKSFLCMMGAGTEKEDADRLIFALKEISDKGFCKKGQKIDSKMKFPKCGKKVMDAWQAEDMKIRTINIQKAEGKTSSSYLVPYPPGVPIVCPGEIITSEMIEYINSLSENSVEGMSADNMVYIIDEEPI